MPDTNPTVSVIMSVYNTECYISEAILSILNQSLTDFEFIIVNDGSTDNTQTILNKFQKQDSRITVIWNETNLGLIKSLNKALDTATGKYIARMDADDISLPHRLAIQTEFLRSHSDIFLVGTATTIIDERGQVLGTTRVTTKPDAICAKLEKSNCLSHPSIMFLSEPFIRYRDKALHCEDYDLYLRLLLAGKKLANLSEPLIKYRFIKQSISFSNSFYAHKFALKMRHFYFQCKSTGWSDYDNFNPKTILELKPPKFSERLADERYINLLYELHNRGLLKKYAAKYLSQHGFFNKVAIYYLIACLPQRIIRLMEKLHNR
ncbi:MAG: glycosyltransferase family 2 protein [Patescibacteria group bacterium]|jgi:glycosyltransferase involved in cell wall biosynthesis